MVNLLFSIKKSLEIINSKFQKSKKKFCEDLWEEIQDKFQNVWLQFVGVAF